jgi:hypothetical protein
LVAFHFDFGSTRTSTGDEPYLPTVVLLVTAPVQVVL